MTPIPQTSLPYNISWKGYLGLLSLDANPAEWSPRLTQLRQEYAKKKSTMIVKPTVDPVQDLEKNNPLSVDSHSSWALYFKNEELIKDINKDLSRLYPQGYEDYYQQPDIQEILRSILFVWSREHGDISYRQGMHDLVAVIAYVVLQPNEASIHTKLERMMSIDDDRLILTPEDAAALELAVDPSYYEHDIYLMFEKLLDVVGPLYQVVRDGEAEPSDKTPVLRLCHSIHTYYLRRTDPNLQAHLDEMQVFPELYAFRWIRLLFAREFALEGVVRVWDAMFQELGGPPNPSLVFVEGPPLLPYLCVVMLQHARDGLLDSDSTTCLDRIMNDLKVQDVSLLIQKAKLLQNPCLLQSTTVNVVKFEDGPLGIVLKQHKGDTDRSLYVSGFNCLADGSAAQAETSGMIDVGDEVVAVNGVHVNGISTDELVLWVQKAGRPIFIAFRKGDMLSQSGEVIQQPVHPELFPGETTFAHVECALETYTSHGSQLNSSGVDGRLVLTNYRCIFQPKAPSSLSWQIAVLSVYKLERQASHDFSGRDRGLSISPSKVAISCKDGQVRTFVFPMKKEFDRFIVCLNALAFATKLEDMFCFTYVDENLSVEGAYSFEKEYRRLGLLGNTNWRVLDQNYMLCATYPRYLLVPSQVSNVMLERSAAFRSRARIPVATWVHPNNKAVLARSSQPLVGLKWQRCAEDEEMLSLLMRAGGNTKGIYYIIDARSQLAAAGNRALGKGTELPSNYPGSKLKYMNVDNIHALSESYRQITALFQASSFSNEDSNYLQKLYASAWLKNVKNVLSSAAVIAEIIDSEGVSVLTHCSDGWDRTPQMVSLAQIMLDGFHRTIKGFMTLVEKEWCSFGHQFTLRCGHGNKGAEEERSPAFLLFLDCVWQMLEQRPKAFELKENLLIFLADHVNSCKFDTFVFNSEQERLNFPKRGYSVWSYLETHIAEFTNTAYGATESPILPSVNPKNIRLWEGYFCRWDESLVPRKEPYFQL